MQQSKCPSCGATVFDQANAGADVREMLINCQYCGSQFTVSNPNYREPQAQSVSYTYNSTSFTYTNNTRPGTGWNQAGDWQHKFTSIFGLIMAYIVVVPAVICLGVGIFKRDGGAVAGGAILALAFMFFFLLAKASKKELKRRAAERGNQG
ncbi:hypothetical protein SAMN05444266_101290 [Chitinophaga jiangningensis]|uniref:Uncharacterized protein n=1 Tax=Chitinophaga jiangningensis TaxID=1419482 RepID=A0A1M6VNK0_9BACT|nr:hypothetical protein [Chitinophaga jiangningensis]SHK83092.1 hypothetical protein SAMN05444266_101290 [Chitinophaga jiangningensis]